MVDKAAILERLFAQRRIKFTGCWEWTGYCYPAGYGQIWADGEQWRVHRLMYVLEHGAVPDGLNVLHSCDNPPCFNPAHLRAGTQQENIRDSVLRERHGLSKAPKTWDSSGSAHWSICVNDHDMTDPANVYIDPRKRRRCRICRNAAVAKCVAKRKALRNTTFSNTSVGK